MCVPAITRRCDSDEPCGQFSRETQTNLSWRGAHGMGSQTTGMAARCRLLSSDSAFFALFRKNYEIDTLLLFQWQPHINSPYQLRAFSVNADHACNFCGTTQHANSTGYVPQLPRVDRGRASPTTRDAALPIASLDDCEILVRMRKISSFRFSADTWPTQVARFAEPDTLSLKIENHVSTFPILIALRLSRHGAADQDLPFASIGQRFVQIVHCAAKNPRLARPADA